MEDNKNVVDICNNLREDSINNVNTVVGLIEADLFITELIKRIAKVIVDNKENKK